MCLSLMGKKQTKTKHQMSVLGAEIQIFHDIAEQLGITETIV